MNFKTRLPIVIALGNRKNSMNEFSSITGLNNPGVYAFWWSGNKEELLSLNRKVMLRGKKITNREKECEKFGDVGEYRDHEYEWNHIHESGSICLYVGKSSIIMNRIKLHLEARVCSTKWYTPFIWNKKVRTPDIKENYIIKRTSACQFRAGLEHLFKNHPSTLEDKLQKIDISFQPINEFEERFYIEDLAVGYYSPWFNLDCER